MWGFVGVRKPGLRLYGVGEIKGEKARVGVGGLVVH